jgi:phosphatidylglycerophosphate synthase
LLDRVLLDLTRPLVAALARPLVAAGIRADTVTAFGAFCGLAAGAAIAAGGYGWAVLLGVLRSVSDGVDGAIARATGPTDRGAFLDATADFLFYAAVPLGFAVADPAANALPAAFLLACFLGTGATFLAFAVQAERRGLTNTRLPDKGFYYLGGLTEGTETLLCFALMCLWPSAFPLLAWAFGGLCLITVVARIRHSIRVLH